MLPNLAEIKAKRKKFNISQNKLAEIYGCTQTIISRIESGDIDPPYSKVKKIFEYLESESERQKQAMPERKAFEIMSKKIISLNSESKVKDAINLMSKYEISQVPIIDEDKNLGSITARKIQKLITDNPDIGNVNIMLVRELPFPEVQKDWEVKDISYLVVNYPAVLVKEYDNYIGIITNADFFKVV